MTGPYAGAALAYVEHGWSPISLPTGRKADPLLGWTGYHGRYVTSPEDVTVHDRGHYAGEAALIVIADHVLGNPAHQEGIPNRSKDSPRSWL